MLIFFSRLLSRRYRLSWQWPWLNPSNIVSLLLPLGVQEIRQCLPVTFSKSGVFSRKSDPKPQNYGPEFPVHFCSGFQNRNSDRFGNNRKLRNSKWSKMTLKWSKWSNFSPKLSFEFLTRLTIFLIPNICTPLMMTTTTKLTLFQKNRWALR